MRKLLWLSFALQFLVCQSQSDIKGPPQVKERVVQKVGRIGETLKIQCPIVGVPPPIFEWEKDGGVIDDITWVRYRKNKNSLKIRHVNRDDTGVYTCKGINGFGSAHARIELIVVESNTEEAALNVAPPVFTVDTRMLANTPFVKEIGQLFQITCEAIGSPRPSIRWFKDGHEIHDSVFPKRRQGEDSTGPSTVELQVLGTVDAGVYTCLARNSAGVRDLNFTLNVDLKSMQHAVVTEAGPTNSTVVEGERATLRCKVKSVELPHIKWLKKLDSEQVEESFDMQNRKVVNVYTLNMGNEKYRVLNTDPDVMVGNEEYLNKLVIPSARIEDSGMYICFVTNSGFGALTYKSAFLRVLPRELMANNEIVITERPSSATSDGLLLTLIISLVVLTFIVGIFVIVCIMKRSHQGVKRPSSAGITSISNNHLSRGPEEEDCMIQQRPFLMAAEIKYDTSPTSLPPPQLFSSTPGSSIGQWSRTVYPAYGGRLKTYSGNNLMLPPNNHYESPAKFNLDRTVSPNLYEVPYSHLANNVSKKSLSGNSNTSLHPLVHARSGTVQPRYPVNSSFRPPQTAASSLEVEQKQAYPFRSYPYFQYLNDYET